MTVQKGWRHRGCPDNLGMHGFWHQMVLDRQDAWRVQHAQWYGAVVPQHDTLKQEPPMRSTINLDDALLERAKSLTGTNETAVLVRQALETLVRVESGKRLIALGGSMPDADAAPRRRSKAAR